jgi:hypothetical protein
LLQPAAKIAHGPSELLEPGLVGQLGGPRIGSLEAGGLELRSVVFLGAFDGGVLLPQSRHFTLETGDFENELLTFVFDGSPMKAAFGGFLDPAHGFPNLSQSRPLTSDTDILARSGPRRTSPPRFF